MSIHSNATFAIVLVAALAVGVVLGILIARAS
jgi:uncharacterized protein YneF (UPF0154 family)